ncbi:MAG TPA: DUF1800 domain-containing protein [Tepidisphaeraceae bacterium]|nr:DUF1800 domain-containing protein [Tepidisphaeraceae bacterium]
MHPLLQPYIPTENDPFDALKAAHLLNRAGFGGTPSEIEAIMNLGPQAAVDQLLDFPDAGAEEQSQTDVPNLTSIAEYPSTYRELQRSLVGKTDDEKKEIRQKVMNANREALQATVDWWMQRMAFGPHPLQEKLTLFWHGHFVTSAKDERSASLMWKQHELLRENAAGNFRHFVRAISRDPAMLDYLNNTQNRKAHPNENYGRELMELFTLGIGNYTETDVKEAARAFTGWAHDGDDFIFRKFDHDDGEKTFLGHTGNFDGDDVIEIILSQPVCARFIGAKLFRYFAYEDVDDTLAEGLAQILRGNRWDLRPVVRTILTSKAFYSREAIGTQIKSPIQLVLGTVRLLELQMPPQRALMGALTQMGQLPFAPPNVRGWPGGRMWISTSTMFVRYNTAVFLAGGGSAAFPKLQGKKFGAVGKRNNTVEVAGTNFSPVASTGDGDALVDEWIARLIQRPVSEEKRKVLTDALAGRPDKPDNVRKMIQLIVSMPEYQLC